MMTVDDSTTPFAIPAGNGQVYRFTGQLLASSDSRRNGAHRWISFSLYRSTGGSYVLARVGHSTLYHSPSCDVVSRNRLEVGTPPTGGVPCEECHPDPDGPVCPEQPRHWAAIIKDAPGVLKALQRSNGEQQYVTKVAARLVEQAAVKDRALAEAWSVQVVD
jgi:hypothetical protein